MAVNWKVGSHCQIKADDILTINQQLLTNLNRNIDKMFFVFCFFEENIGNMLNEANVVQQLSLDLHH